jgi:hypothetical protein
MHTFILTAAERASLKNVHYFLVAVFAVDEDENFHFSPFIFKYSLLDGRISIKCKCTCCHGSRFGCICIFFIREKKKLKQSTVDAPLKNIFKFLPSFIRSLKHEGLKTQLVKFLNLS